MFSQHCFARWFFWCNFASLVDCCFASLVDIGGGGFGYRLFLFVTARILRILFVSLQM